MQEEDRRRVGVAVVLVVQGQVVGADEAAEVGVAASTRNDAQAKSLGEWLRARVVDVPDALLP